MDLRSGDLIGVSAANSKLGQAISASGQTDGNYDHIGLVKLDGEQVFVWNANMTHGVSRELLADFIARETDKEPRIFHVYRPNAEIDIAAALNFLQCQLGLPYNYSFRPSGTTFYCADLIARAYPDGFFAANPMKFNGEYWADYYRKLGTTIPNDELGFHPADMLKQENLTYLGELDLPG